LPRGGLARASRGCGGAVLSSPRGPSSTENTLTSWTSGVEVRLEGAWFGWGPLLLLPLVPTPAIRDAMALLR
jgi:hypothetical protein